MNIHDISNLMRGVCRWCRLRFDTLILTVKEEYFFFLDQISAVIRDYFSQIVLWLEIIISHLMLWIGNIISMVANDDCGHQDKFLDGAKMAS